MKVTKISGANEGCSCINCKTRDADITVILGESTKTKNVSMMQINLCNECGWDLSEILNETAYTSFKESSR